MSSARRWAPNWNWSDATSKNCAARIENMAAIRNDYNIIQQQRSIHTIRLQFLIFLTKLSKTETQKKSKRNFESKQTKLINSLQQIKRTRINIHCILCLLSIEVNRLRSFFVFFSSWVIRTYRLSLLATIVASYETWIFIRQL